VKIWIGVTDNRWFEYLSSQNPLPDEVNFWQPSLTSFKALSSKELFLFKLHSPLDFIVGGGFFETSTIIPIALAWETFGEKNGVKALDDFLPVLKKYNKEINNKNIHTLSIVCNVLSTPFFFKREDWIDIPQSWSSNIVRGKIYKTEEAEGFNLFKMISERLVKYNPLLTISKYEMPDSTAIYGNPYLTKSRLGQGGFRLIVTDIYYKKCAITGERTLPVLEAAHIQPISKNGPNIITNGLLLRSDLHKLFDTGYITITPDLKVEVSRRIREEFENGRDYYAVHGSSLKSVPEEKNKPSINYLSWHNENIFLS